MSVFRKELERMKLPEIYINENKEYYLDPFRKRLIYKTPEETIRQQVLRYLVDIVGVPQNMIQVEMLLSKYGVKSIRRADIIIEKFNEIDGTITPLVVVECKAPGILIGESAVTQAVDYADTLATDYIILTNGTDLIIAKYEAESNQYIDLKEIPTYKEMLDGKGTPLPIEPPKERFSFESLTTNQDYYSGYEFNPKTPKTLLPFLTNLWEGFLDTSHSMPAKQYRIFTLLEDYGIRYLSCGNAAGGTYQGAYRSFLIEYKGNTKFMNLGFFDYGTTTIMTVSIDQDDNQPHNSLQYSVDTNLVKKGETYQFIHSGRIAVGNIGSGKVSELKALLKFMYPNIIINDKIDLGTVHNNSLLYLDTPEVTNLVENALSYAIIRDEYRSIVKNRAIEKQKEISERK